MGCAKRALIVGGGIGGMDQAIALAKDGVEVHVVEAARREDQLGTGINLQHNALFALQEVGLLEECKAEGFAWETISNRHAVSGQLLNSNTVGWPPRPGVPGALGIMRTTFAEILARNAIEAGVRISYQTKVATLEQDGEGVSVELTDGTSDRADVLIAADGAYSQIRGMVFGEEHKLAYAGQGVWRFTVPRPKSLDGFTLFRTDEGRSVGFLPLAEDIAYYFMLETSEQPLRVPAEKAADMLTDRMADFKVPEIQDVLPLMHQGWHVSYRPFDILLMPPPWHRGRVALVGDTAHSLTPQLTSGGGMAIEDAVVMAQELRNRDSVDEALAAYSDRRQKRVKLVFEASYRICQLEMGRSTDGVAGTAVMLDALRHLGEPY
jgi:2-polyprenyl-6-methoxyphenol hydroxylase-like FAD-dependent oxidoreductase